MNLLKTFHLPARVTALLLILPLSLFLLSVFFLPIGGLLSRAVEDPDLADAMPLTVSAISNWDGRDLPSAEVYDALAEELLSARASRTVGIPARRLNYDDGSLRQIITVSARKLPATPVPGEDWKATLQAIDPAWGQPEIWQAIKRAKGPYTSFYLLTGFDLRWEADSGIQRVEDGGLYTQVLTRTFQIAAIVTLLSIILALPTAYLMLNAPFGFASILMVMLLLPLWTSILVRSAAWLVILQKNGIINSFLMEIGAISAPLELIYNRTGVLIALTHILLPYAVLPVLGAMRNVPVNQTLAAHSLGAGPIRTFLAVYLPQIMPGVSAGGLLVFILALGYYITPLLLGGAGDQLLPYYIAFNTTQTLNWGLAAALGVILLVTTLLLYAVYVRVIGAERIGL
jgi:putative spermidine/putrescine transport system permease protein